MNTEPREVPLSIRLYLRLCIAPEAYVGLALSVLMFLFALFAAAKVHNNTLYGAWLATGIFSIIGMLALFFPIRAWFISNKAIWLLQHGSTTPAKFFGVNLTGTWIISAPVVKFTYQVEGKTYSASTQMTGVSHFTIDTCKDVFYDPTQPEQSVVLHGLPDGVHFDEPTGRFWCNWLFYVPSLLAAAIICGEIVAIVVLVVRAI